MNISQSSSSNLAQVARAAINRFFHPNSHPKMSHQPLPPTTTATTTTGPASASPVSPTYSDTGSGFSAPSPSPFSSSSTSTSATSFQSSGHTDFTDFTQQSNSLYDFASSEQDPTITDVVDSGLACLYNPNANDVLPGGPSSDYSAFASAHPPGNPGAVVYTSAGELDLNATYGNIMATDYSSPTAPNDCNSFITWSPKNNTQNITDSNNSYQRLQQQQSQHIADATSTSTSNTASRAPASNSTTVRQSSPSAPTSNSNGLYPSSNPNASSGPAKPGMLGQLYIPSSQPSSSAAPVHSPIPSRYAGSEAVVSGGQPNPSYSHSQSMMAPQSQYQHNHHQRHSSSGSTGSNGGHPLLFDVDVDEWHPKPGAQSHSQHNQQHMRYSSAGSASVSPPQMFHQPSMSYGSQQSHPPSHPHAQSLHLNLNLNAHPTGSPASSLSSLSPGQMSLPLTPGHEFGHGLGADYGMVINGSGNGLGLAMSGPPPTPMSSTASLSPVIPGPSSYPVTSGRGAGVNNSQALLAQRRASMGIAQPSTSPNAGSLSPRQHHHPYAQGYQQRGTHGRSPLHPNQIQQARRSPLHQEFFDDGASGIGKAGSMNPGNIPEDDAYAGQYEKMYRERQRRESKRQDRGRDGPQPSVSLDQRRHSAPLVDVQFPARSQPQPQGGYPPPVLLSEMGRRPSAPAVHQVHHNQQQRYANPNNGGYAPGVSTSPSSVSSSRSVPLAPSLSASSSTSSTSSRSPVAHIPSQSLPSQHSTLAAAAAAHHGSTRLLSDMVNSGSMTCIPGSVYDEEGINVVSEGADMSSIMQLDIDEKVAQQHQPTFDMDMGGMESLMDVESAVHGHGMAGDMGVGIDMDMDILRMNMEMSMTNSGLQSSGPTNTSSTSASNIYIPPMPVTVDMNDLTDAHNNAANQGISPRMMMLDDAGKTGDSVDQPQDMYDFESALDAAPSPTLVGVSGIGVVQDWQKAGGEYDSADSSESESDGEGTGLLSDIEGGEGKGVVGRNGGEGDGGAVKGRDGRQRRGKTGTALAVDGLTGGAGAGRKVGAGGKPTMKQRASNRTITSRSTRSKASTQTLTQRNVDGQAGDGLADEGEEVGGEGDEDLLSSSDESFDYDDEKDGEFVPRSRSKGAGGSRSASRRATSNNAAASGNSASAPAGGRRSAGSRGLRSRGSANGRYNPYSVYAATAAAAASQPSGESGSSTTPPGTGLRTLNVPGFEGSTDGSVSPSVGGDLELGPDGKTRKVRPAASLPVPVPVPNLTKKSRGRRVPTVSSLEELRKAGSAQGTATSGRKGRGGAGAKGARMYLCDVEGCGKCFARGEHLKRHVRSIHTNEKPHTCPYPGCGKDFSRHDNLGQHMRVHKDYVPPPNPAKA
ncbi:STE-12 alpha [Coprinopsis cinerea AmutBmut pab1-1]|nr:STE-12 alpha [Coprinopsis cinerea AmutBmut pab1-1]